MPGSSTSFGTVRLCDPPQWAVGAGVLRNLVWDRLHGFVQPTLAADVDVAYFDASELSREAEQDWERRLNQLRPGVPWEVKNQAAVHMWYERKFGYAVPPLCSLEDAVATWPETATAVAVRLLPNDDIEVVAPCGLDDLFGLILRRNPTRVSVEEFRRRYTTKQIAKRWPRVRIIDGQPP